MRNTRRGQSSARGGGQSGGRRPGSAGRRAEGTGSEPRGREVRNEPDRSIARGETAKPPRGGGKDRPDGAKGPRGSGDDRRGAAKDFRGAQRDDRSGGPRPRHKARGPEREVQTAGAHRPPRRPTPMAVPVSTGAPPGEMRIAKALARAGLCSRRDAERWIAEGRVSVNGTTLTSPALDVGPSDRILVDGKPLPSAEPVKLWRYHKPRGVVTTHRDPEGRPTVFDKLPEDMPRVMSIGRLDFNTEGLLLLTNDGALARHLELPATGWLRRYRVRAHGKVTQADLDKLRNGVQVEGVRYGPIEATLEKEQGANVWLSIGLREGKNREVRKVLGTLGLDVNRLIRVSFGPFQLLDLVPGAVDQVKRRVIMDQLGPALSREFGLADLTEGPERRGRRGSGPAGDQDA